MRLFVIEDLEVLCLQAVHRVALLVAYYYWNQCLVDVDLKGRGQVTRLVRLLSGDVCGDEDRRQAKSNNYA
jgi:hypothetical protein